ncbi:ComEC/Rec2 family competence protein [Caulobacter sp. RL271]|uniref:MBL fold metallo-hydrolase n=1 Tax=Caulobacter segnis TaxID=88688 RepID=A0ABY4ZT57_9CAUL|nr:MBL fold metallo-hydrolase [Caulobacter segnis]USQ95187.1 MBL fold metallo-hydrolase [Caulobacter segnis]
MAPVVTRRGLLLGAAALGVVGLGAAASPPEDEDIVGQPLRPWRRGGLDIHHIATGKGDSTLIIGPDGSSLMIDAGASTTPTPASLDARPGAARRPGEWIGRYARRHLAATGAPRLDAFLATHLHPDHVDGLADVAAALPIGVLVDRDYPDYAYPRPSDAPFAKAYQAFVRERVRGGGRVERFRVGSADQFSLPGAEVRNLAANGEVWTGRGTETRRLFPAIDTLPTADIPDENACSTAIRLRYGAFGYFAAGDLTSHDFDGTLPWRDAETPAARAAGPVDVAVAAHHGMFDATGADVVRALRPRAWIIPAWHVAHPSTDALERMLSPRLYPGPRDVFATGLSPANEMAHKWLTDRLASREGHVVVRVAPGGGRYRVVVTDNRDENERVMSTSGPWAS